MSDSASKKDVEDVLTSIRRLVSSEQPRNRRPDLPKGPGALVLTDAQRVERPAAKGLAAKSLEDRIAELEAAVSSRDDDYEPDGSEDQAQHRPDRIVYTRPPSDAEEAEARGNALRLSGLSLVESAEDTPEDAIEDDSTVPVAFRHARRSAPEENSGDAPPAEEAPMAEDVAEQPREKAEVRPFHNPDEMVDRFEARMENGDDLPRPGPGHNGFSERLEPYVPEGVARQAGETSGSDWDDVDYDAGDEFEDEEFEAALSEAATKPAAGDAEDEAPSQPDALETPTEVPQPVQAAPALSEEALEALDEDTLRPIVAKLIREELQGELGERITRNVRKLVRREILRAINSREFE